MVEYVSLNYKDLSLDSLHPYKSQPQQCVLITLGLEVETGETRELNQKGWTPDSVKDPVSILKK